MKAARNEIDKDLLLDDHFLHATLQVLVIVGPELGVFSTELAPQVLGLP